MTSLCIFIEHEYQHLSLQQNHTTAIGYNTAVPEFGGNNHDLSLISLHCLCFQAKRWFLCCFIQNETTCTVGFFYF